MQPDRRKVVLGGILGFITQPLQTALQQNSEEIVVIMAARLTARGIPADDPAAVAQAVGEPSIEVGTDPDGPWVRVDGQDVTAAVRTQEVTSAVSAVARVPQVRARLIALQREIIARARAEGRGIVAEGRDIGTVVAPDAVVKVYLTASERVRAQRRTAESVASPRRHRQYQPARCQPARCQPARYWPG